MAKRRQKAAKKQAQVRAAARARDARTKAELYTSALDASYSDGLALAPKPKPSAAAGSTAKAQAALSVSREKAETWPTKIRRALDIVSSAGTVLLFEPKPAKRR